MNVQRRRFTGHFRPLAIAFVSALSSGCLPLPLHYYVPSQEGAKNVRMSCGGGPISGASSFGISPRYHLLVSLSGSLIVIIDAEPLAAIEFDPTLIRVEADGRPIPLNSVRYRKTNYGAEPARDTKGAITVDTGRLQIEVPLKLHGASEVIAHLPPITVNGTVTQLPDIAFKLEWHTHLTIVVGNC
jgi:hypothetical protein